MNSSAVLFYFSVFSSSLVLEYCYYTAFLRIERLQPNMQVYRVILYHGYDRGYEERNGLFLGNNHLEAETKAKSEWLKYNKDSSWEYLSTQLVGRLDDLNNGKILWF